MTPRNCIQDHGRTTPRPKGRITWIHRLVASLTFDAGSVSGGECLPFPCLEKVLGHCLMGPQPPRLEVTAGCSPNKDPLLFHFCIMKEPLDLLEVVFPPVFLNSCSPPILPIPWMNSEFCQLPPHEGFGKLLLAHHLIR